MHEIQCFYFLEFSLEKVKAFKKIEYIAIDA